MASRRKEAHSSWTRKPNHGGAQSYLDAEAEVTGERRSALLKPSDLGPAGPPPMPRAERIERLSSNPRVDLIIADVYEIALSQTSKLREKALREDAEPLDPAELRALGHLGDLIAKITKAQIEREKHDEPESLSREELREALRAQLDALDAEDAG